MNICKLRVVWNTNGKERYFYVKDMEQEMIVVTALSIREVDDDNVSYNVTFVQMLDEQTNEWIDWEDEEGNSFDDCYNDSMDNWFYQMKNNEYYIQ